MKITSSAFEDHRRIPDRYTCNGENINPPLTIEDVPAESKSLLLIVDDPDAPSGVWDHWILVNIDPKTSEIAEGSLPEGSMPLVNSFVEEEYGGPCPPSGPEHRYFFKLYALDTICEELPEDKSQLEQWINEHLLESTELVGTYSKK